MKRKITRDQKDLGGLLGGESIDETIKRLTDIKMELLNAGCQDITVRVDAGYNNVDITAKFSRPETDEEMHKRKKAIEKKKLQIVENTKQRKALYEKLKKEFEGK